MANFDWNCVPLSYEITKNHLQSHQTYDHPLKLNTVTVLESKGTRGGSFGSNASSRSSSMASMLVEPLGMALDGTDPLSQFARQDQELKDPLTEMLSEFTKKREKTVSIKDEVDSSLNWNNKRLGILNRFTTTEKLSLSTSFLKTGSTDGGTENIKAQTVVADKVKFRLEQLDHFEDGSMQHMMNLTQQEYIQRFEQLKSELIQSWNSDQRVKALKIAIQCAKMLTDTAVLQFYPSQYVLITDILDAFGKLVYERLKVKDQSSTISEASRETCQNWFYKIASIRDLIPRLYVEMALFKCYEFLTPCEFEKNLLRITRMLRGIADPLVCVFARCYLVRVGLTVASAKQYLIDNFNDFISIYNVIFSGSTRSELNRQRIDMYTYLSLYAPALDFMMQALLLKHRLYATSIMQNVKTMRHNGLLLNSILNSFKSEYIATNALEFVQMLSSCNTDGISKAQLFRSLGHSISQCAPLQEQRFACLNAAFQTINTFTDPKDYINCVEAWTQFIAENFNIQELNSMLCEINKRMSIGKAYEKHYSQLQSILDKTMQYCKNIEQLLVQDHFLPYLDLFHKDSIKIEVCKSILNIYKQNSQEYTSDPIITNALMYIGKILNDGVTALTVDDERRQISQLICSFIHKVDFRRDFEKQLSFYVEARGTFANLDTVYVTLVYAVNKLAMQSRKIIGGKHTRKTGAFVKACVAYCFITIPSITAIHTQMDLYLLSGQVALSTLCSGQADACFEAALRLVEEVPATIEVDGKIKNMEGYLTSYLSNMLATLVVVPDSPDQGVLYFFRLLLEVVGKFPFNSNSASLTDIYLNALDMLYVQSLEKFPYHIPDVVSNDMLYGHDQKFLAEINVLCGQVVELILNQLKQLGSGKQLRTQATLAMELLQRIVRYADLSRPQTYQLAVNLWLLVIKLDKQIDPKIIARSIRNVEDTYLLVKDLNNERVQSVAKLLARMENKQSER